MLIGGIRDGVAALRKVLAGAGHRVASCECGSSDDQQQSYKSSHEQFPLSLMRVRWPFGHESVPDVRILATRCPAAKRLQKQLPDTLRPWLRPILETVLPGLNKQQNP